MPRPFSLQQSSHHGFLERLPPVGVTSFKSRGEGAELEIYTIVESTRIVDLTLSDCDITFTRQNAT